MGCDGTGNCRGCLSVVSIHAPAWGATSSSHLGLYLGSAFQSTHPHGVRLTGLRWVDIRNLFQSTHPHGVRHKPNVAAHGGVSVSIHAPAWGATNKFLLQVLFHLRFNPRTRMGCDKQVPFASSLSSAFQSTHPHGVRLNDRLIILNPRLFQSTHPHGVRQITDYVYTEIGSFNPRTRMGCDKVETGFLQEHRVSIHAPAWGATVISYNLYCDK